jgi:transcriptional regulator with XRE-family HTH domain
MSGLKGEKFKAIREELGLTQEQIAEVLCLYGKQAISNIESGRNNPGALVSALMEALVKLPEKRSKELQDLLRSISRKYPRTRTERK